MSVLSDAQIIALWLLEGGSIATAPEALARALSESSGNTMATSSNPDGGTNAGLYQLDTKGVGAGYSIAQLQNPYLNTQVTIAQTNGGQNWAEWADNWSEFIGPAQSAVSSFTNTTANIESLLASVTTGGAGGKGTAGNPAASPDTAAGLLSQTTGALSAAGTLVHDAAIALNDVLEWFKPGQGFRLGAALVAFAAGYAAFRLWAV